MSVTFLSNCNATTSSKEEPCLCAQMAEGFSKMMAGLDSPEIRASLKTEAWEDCPRCKGTGVETVEESDAPSINLANENARLLLSILGIDSDDLCGDINKAIKDFNSLKDLKEEVDDAWDELAKVPEIIGIKSYPKKGGLLWKAIEVLRLQLYKKC